MNTSPSRLPALRFARALPFAMILALSVGWLTPHASAETKSKKKSNAGRSTSSKPKLPFPSPKEMAARFHQTVAENHAGGNHPFPFPPPFAAGRSPFPSRSVIEEVAPRAVRPAPPAYREPVTPYPDPESDRYDPYGRYEPYDQYEYGQADRYGYTDRYEFDNVPQQRYDERPYQAPYRELDPRFEETQPAPRQPPRSSQPRTEPRPAPRTEPVPQREPAPRPPVSQGESDLPFARPVPGQQGFVTLDGYSGMIDVRGIAPGTPVEVPDSTTPDGTRRFRVP